MSNPWVAVSKKLPISCAYYQCYTNDGNIITCYLSIGQFWTLAPGGNYSGDLWGSELAQKLSPRRKVIHWRELPKPPKDAEKEVKFYK